jgi:plasmid stabilization system protein ParE
MSVKEILITRRAALDAGRIFDYSEKQWGHRVATEYLSGIEGAIAAIDQLPQGTLRPIPGFTESPLRIIRVQEHILVCIETVDIICILALFHGAMNIHARLYQLEPTLIHEFQAQYHRWIAQKDNH